MGCTVVAMAECVSHQEGGWASKQASLEREVGVTRPLENLAIRHGIGTAKDRKSFLSLSHTTVYLFSLDSLVDGN